MYSEIACIEAKHLIDNIIESIWFTTFELPFFFVKEHNKLHAIRRAWPS